jgi:hypothetical protein
MTSTHATNMAAPAGSEQDLPVGPECGTRHHAQNVGWHPRRASPSPTLEICPALVWAGMCGAGQAMARELDARTWTVERGSLPDLATDLLVAGDGDVRHAARSRPRDTQALARLATARPPKD